MLFYVVCSFVLKKMYLPTTVDELFKSLQVKAANILVAIYRYLLLLSEVANL